MTPVERIWYAITDIESAAERIEGIQSVEILERPATGLLGLKWRETRTMFGKVATLIMDFSAEPQSFSAKILSATMGFLFKGPTQKALQKDLENIKVAVERD